MRTSPPRPIALVTLLLGAAPARADVVATGHDAITTPGTPVLVRAKFERTLIGFVRPDLVREQVEFTLLGRSPRDLTDEEGIAEAVVRPRVSGVFPIRARIVTRPDAPAAESRLFVYPRELPVAVVDVDGTLSDMAELKVLFAGAEAPCYPHSPELLQELAQTHAIVYLTARDDALTAETRAFLARHRFPPGPVLFNELGLRGEAFEQLRPSNHGAFKLRVIKELMGRGLRVVVGIGNAETDAEAYEGAKLRSYIRTELAAEGPSFRFTDYQALRLRLQEDGVLPPAEEPAPPGEAAPAAQEEAPEEAPEQAPAER